jgi:hypothetical protein
MGSSPSDPRSQGWNEVNDQSRREYFAEHGRWPRPTDLAPPKERHTVTFTRAAVSPAVSPAVSYKSPERLAWDAAYAHEQGHGPLSSKWELQGGKLTMVWTLPTQVASPRGRY